MESPQAFFTVAIALLVVSAVLIVFYLRRMMTNRTLHVQERQARFALFAFVVILVDYAILVGAFRFPWEPSLAIFSLYGLVGFSGLIGSRERRAGKVVMDERDREIDKGAALAGFASFYLLLWLVWFVSWSCAGTSAVLTVRYALLGMLLMGGAILMWTVRALVTLILYRRDDLAEAN
jgi:hypothetical protein